MHHIKCASAQRPLSLEIRSVTCGFAAVSRRDESGEVHHSSRPDDELRRGRVDGQRVGTLGVCVDLVLHRHLTHNNTSQ